MYKRKDVIPNKLKECRKTCGYSQAQVAEALGFSSSVTLSHWEHGTNIPNIINLFKLSRLFGVAPTDLYPDLVAKNEELVRFPCPVLKDVSCSISKKQT